VWLASPSSRKCQLTVEAAEKTRAKYRDCAASMTKVAGILIFTYVGLAKSDTDEIKPLAMRVSGTPDGLAL
jgi:hypothetical protein